MNLLDAEQQDSLKRDIDDYLFQMIGVEGRINNVVYDRRAEKSEKLRQVLGEIEWEHRSTLSDLQWRLNKASAALLPLETEDIRTPAFAEYLALGRDRFWQQPALNINQILHRIFAFKRLVVADGQIAHIEDTIQQRKPWRSDLS